MVDVKAARSRPDISAANTLAEKRKGGGERDRAVLVENAQNTEAERPEFTPLDALWPWPSHFISLRLQLKVKPRRAAPRSGNVVDVGPKSQRGGLEWRRKKTTDFGARSTVHL